MFTITSGGVPVVRLRRKPSRIAVFALAFVVLSLPASILAAGASPTSDTATEALCRKYFKHTVCSEALGRWLPHVEADGGRSAPRTQTRIFDGFRKTAETTEWPFSAYAPTGTAFSYGDAGPPRGSIVYDRRNRVVFYGQGCCSWFSVVLAANVASPPVALADRNVSRIATDSGVHLGDSPASVMRVYGSAQLQRVSKHPEMQLLLYENSTPPKPLCVQQQDFGFTHGRLSYIDVYDGC
ncbi:MAG TPA: hypothetical protein VFE70_04060 [Candidatus Elarobacter sp.]|nr:hypothetical protein [Candidatus Elarobacter sp.]